MKIHLIFVAMMFILISSFAFGTNQAFADELSIVSPSSGTLYVKSTVGVCPSPQNFVVHYKPNSHSKPDLNLTPSVSILSVPRSHAEVEGFDLSYNVVIPLSIDTVAADLAVGEHNFYIRIYTSGLEVFLDVKVKIENRPTVYGTYFNNSYLPQSDFRFTNEQASPSQPIQIVAPNNSAISWNATTSANWLNLSQASGTTPSTFQVSTNANVASLSDGNYTARINFSYPNTNYVTNSVDIKLTVKRTRLASGKALTLGQYLLSPNEEYKLVMQIDGNLVLYRTSDNFAMWASNTYGIGANLCEMQAEDGNLVIYNAGGQPLWASATDGNAGAVLILQDDGKVVIYKSGKPIWSTADLHSGRTLQSGRILRSGNGQYKLEMQTDGNLALRNASSQIIWATNTYGNPGSRVEMQVDGNLVIRTPSNQIIWASNTYTTSNQPNNGSILNVQDDGSLFITRPDGTPIWSRTQGRLY